MVDMDDPDFDPSGWFDLEEWDDGWDEDVYEREREEGEAI